MTEPVDLVILLAGGTVLFLFGRAFRALPIETQRRWRTAVVAISLVVGAIALIVWIKLLLDYRP